MKLNRIQYTRLCKGFVASILMSGLGANVSQAAPIQSPQFLSIHGAACQPANLQQSINFATSWHQNGIRNVNALGSGRNFFVICPVGISHDGELTPGTDITMHLRYDDRSADVALRISCTARRLTFDTAGFVKSVTATDTTAGTGSAFTAIVLNDVIADGDLNFVANEESVSAVCSLVPQSGIGGMSSNHN